MANDKRICKACGTEYRYCPTCSKYANKPKWMWKCDTEECNAVFDTVSAYKMGVGSKEEIREVINEYKIKDYSKYVDSIRTFLEKNFPVKNSFKQKKKFVEDMDIDFIATEEPVATSEELNGISDLL